MYISLSLSIYIHFTHTLLTHTHTPLLSDNSSRRTHLTLTHTHLLHKYLTQHISHTLTQLLSYSHLPRKSGRCLADTKRTPATPKESKQLPDVKMLRLPCKSSGRCTKCCACHANARGPSRRPNAHRQVPDSQSAAPATQK